MQKLLKKYSVLVGVALVTLASYYAGLKSLSLLITLLTASYGIGWAIQSTINVDIETRTHTGNFWLPGLGLFAVFYIASLVLAPATITVFLVIGMLIAGLAGVLHKLWQITFRRA